MNLTYISHASAKLDSCFYGGLHCYCRAVAHNMVFFVVLFVASTTFWAGRKLCPAS